jgi:hypothetical protein
VRVLFWYCEKFAWTPTLKTLDALLYNAEREGFLATSDRNMTIRADNPAGMLDLMVNPIEAQLKN